MEDMCIYVRFDDVTNQLILGGAFWQDMGRFVCTVTNGGFGYGSKC